MNLLQAVYPDGMSREKCRGILQAILDDWKVMPPINSLEAGTVNEIAYWCEYWNIHPALLLATMKMEQPGVWDKKGAVPTPWQCKALCGVVGQDSAGTSRPNLLGIGMQIYRACRAYAWSLGVVSDTTFGPNHSWYPQRERYHPYMGIEMFDNPKSVYQPKNPVEYALLSFCPHLDRLRDAEEKFDLFYFNF